MLSKAYQLGATKAADEALEKLSFSLVTAPVAGGLVGGISSMIGGVPGSLLEERRPFKDAVLQGAAAGLGAKALPYLGKGFRQKVLLGLLGLAGGYRGTEAFLDRSRRKAMMGL